MIDASNTPRPPGEWLRMPSVIAPTKTAKNSVMFAAAPAGNSTYSVSAAPLMSITATASRAKARPRPGSG